MGKVTRDKKWLTHPAPPEYCALTAWHWLHPKFRQTPPAVEFGWRMMYSSAPETDPVQFKRFAKAFKACLKGEAQALCSAQ